jgi:DNA mismatch repair protein MutS2
MIKLNKISNKSLTDLEWMGIVQKWRELCVTIEGKALTQSIHFASSIDQAQFRSNLIKEIRFLSSINVKLSVDGISPIGEIVKRLNRGGSIKAESLHKVMVQLSISGQIIKTVFSEETEFLPLLLEELDSMGHLQSLLSDSIDPDGQLKSTASPELFGLRTRKTELQKELIKILGNIKERPQITPYLQDDYHTQREDRFVLPIKSEFRSQVNGIIHGTSGSGQTVFMEPAEVVNLNNRLKSIQTDIEIEEFKILSRLANAVAEVTDELIKNEEILTELDIWIGGAKLSTLFDGTPLKWSEKNVIDLMEARHPLLVLDNVDVVPNDIMMKKGKVLIITGPNGGGKTVTIKTTGLIYLMGRMGLHVPCKRNSSLPFFHGILTMIGDEQNIATHLSTFSAQIQNMKRVMENSNENHLVILDELAVGTDPSQGSVLAQSVLEHLSKNKVTTLVTTHFSRLKALAVINEGFINASVGGKAAKPDFLLIPGLPGTSEGLAVAQRLGLNSSVINRAKSLLGEGDNKIDQILNELFMMKKELRDNVDQIETEKSELQKEVNRLAAIRVSKEQELDRLRKEGYQALLEETVSIRRLIAHLQVEAKKDSVTRVRKKELTNSAEKITAIVADKMKKYQGPTADPETVKPGKKFRSRTLGAVVEIVKIGPDGQVLATLGNLSTWIDLSDLEMELEPSSQKEKPSKSKSKPVDKTPPIPKPAYLNPMEQLDKFVVTPGNSLDIRGKRVDAAINELDRYLDQMILDGNPGCAIIHGYGTGALRSTVREHLKSSPFVKLFRPGERGEGGDGVTVLIMI